MGADVRSRYRCREVHDTGKETNVVIGALWNKRAVKDSVLYVVPNKCKEGSHMHRDSHKPTFSSTHVHRHNPRLN